LSSFLPFTVARTWSFATWNAGGFYARIQDSHLVTDISRHDILIVQETQSTRSPYLSTHNVWAIPALPPGEKGGRPSGGLALFVKKTLPYAWEQIATDNMYYQICLIRFERETCLIVNVYSPPKCADAYDLIFAPIADVLSRYPQTPCIVAGDFNARVGDAQMADPDDEYLSLLPPLNLDRQTNENRAGFLSFLEAADL
jgi:exonuclease III